MLLVSPLRNRSRAENVSRESPGLGRSSRRAAVLKILLDPSEGACLFCLRPDCLLGRYDVACGTLLERRLLGDLGRSAGVLASIYRSEEGRRGGAWDSRRRAIDHFVNEGMRKRNRRMSLHHHIDCCPGALGRNLLRPCVNGAPTTRLGHSLRFH